MALIGRGGRLQNEDSRVKTLSGSAASPQTRGSNKLHIARLVSHTMYTTLGGVAGFQAGRKMSVRRHTHGPLPQPLLLHLSTLQLQLDPQPIAARGDEHEPHSLDTEDDATDIEEDARTRPNANAFVRQGVFVAPSTTVGWWKGGGLGLFSGVRMRAGDLIGYYHRVPCETACWVVHVRAP